MGEISGMRIRHRLGHFQSSYYLDVGCNECKTDVMQMVLFLTKGILVNTLSQDSLNPKQNGRILPLGKYTI